MLNPLQTPSSGGDLFPDGGARDIAIDQYPTPDVVIGTDQPDLELVPKLHVNILLLKGHYTTYMASKLSH